MYVLTTYIHKGRLQKKRENFGDLSQLGLTPTLPPYFGTKKFGTSCSESGPPPSFANLGQKGQKKFQDKVTIVKQYSVILLDTLAHVLISYHF